MAQTQPNGKNGNKMQETKASETSKSATPTPPVIHQEDTLESSTVIKALRAEWRKNGSKPMTEAQANEVRDALAASKEMQAKAAKAVQDAADAQSHAIGLIVKYSGQTTVTLEGKRQIIGCRGKSLFLRGMPVFEEGVTI